MKNVTDRRDRAPQLWAATKFSREFGELNTTALKADALVVVLSWAYHGAEGQSARQSTGRAEKGSPRRILVKQPTGNRLTVKAGMPRRLAAGGH